MKETSIKRKGKEKRNNKIRNSLQIKPKLYLPENSLKSKAIKKKSLKSENDESQIKSKFNNKIELPKDKEIDDVNKSIKEDNYKNYFQFNSEKKVIQNSVSQNLIAKILEINKTEYSFINNSSHYLLSQKDDAFSNSINSSNKISFTNIQNILEYKEESKINNKKNENNKILETFPQIKNTNSKKDISKNKSIINNICKSGTHDFRRHSNIKSESAFSFLPHQIENDYKNNSSITDNFKTRLKKADILFGLQQISGSSSSQQLTFRLLSQKNLLNSPISQRSSIKNNNNKIKYNMSKRQKEIAQNIMDLDLVKLQKEVYEYENTDVTDAINRLPTFKYNSNKNNNKNKHIRNIFKSRNNKGKKIKKGKKNIKERFRILRRTGYVYDSLDDEEYEDEEDNNFYFEPSGKFILVLDFIIFIASLFNLLFLPIHLSSSPFNEKNLIKDSVFIFIDIIFIIDFVSGFFTAYFNFDEDLIKNSISIVQNYFKTWFLLDFLCGIPVYSLLKILNNKFENNDCHNNCYFNYTGKNLYHLLELIKLLKLIKTVNDNAARKKIKNKLKKINFFYNWGHFIKQIFKFISILNLSTCLFIFSARNSYPNWILHSNMNIHNFLHIYICSFYLTIATMTTVGYGDIEICSMTERIFEILFLIIGTCLYSWMLTFTSNYIKKMNEKNIKFEQKKEILDDIKINYPLMSDELYRKIYKLLYYKKTHQQVDKNIIIDSLPYSIRTSLLIQMYCPTITNFKFFRYFGNSEFIIEIVSVLRPVVGSKGDVLINEGDYVEDIIFNKFGILSLEIFIDLDNPYEFINQYLIKYNLENFKNNNSEYNSTYRKINSINSSNYTKNSVNFNKMNSINTNNLNFIMTIKNEKSTLGKEKIIKKNFQCLKILNIRKKEHFGDALMFLNEPSPLSVRVNSKNAEVLLLNKTDVVKISSNFPNIWKRMNENSIFNLEQIKHLIMRKLSIFCFSNDIKIKSLYNKKDKDTGQNKINFSLISIPDPIQEDTNQNIILNEINDKTSKDSQIISSQSFDNFKKKTASIIKEAQSSEEITNSMLTKETKYSFDNISTSKKSALKKVNDSTKILNQKENIIDDNINQKRNNKYYAQKITENQNQSLIHSRSYSNFCQNKSHILLNRYTKNSIKKNRAKTYTKANNKENSSENNSPKDSKNCFLNNNPSAIPSPKGINKFNKFADKSKMNKRLISIPPFNFLQNNNNNNYNLNCVPENVNDEIYSNENFDIKIPDNDQNLIINNYIKSQEKSSSNYHESLKKFLISDKKEKQTDVSNNLISKNKFNNLIISSNSTFEIKSSYDNINELTKYTFISNDSLIKKTKIFLIKECGLLWDTKKKFDNIPYLSPIHNRAAKSKSTIKHSKYILNSKLYENTNNINNLSVKNGKNNNYSPPTFSKKLQKLGIKKIGKNNEKLLENSLQNIRKLNKYCSPIKRNATTVGKNAFLNKRNSVCKIMSSNYSPKKGKRKADISSDSIVSIKTKNKLDLITKNMKRDNQNLNNPNEFYADLFNNFYKQKIKKNESEPSILKIKGTKVTQNVREKDSSEENEEEEDKEHNLECN